MSLGVRRPGLFDAMLEQWRAVYLIVAVVFAIGLVALARLPEAVYPPLTFSRILITAENGDLSPVLVRASISRPIEDQVRSVVGVTGVESTSAQGIAAISATFDPKAASPDVALQRVTAAIATVRAELPAETSIAIQQVDPSLAPDTGIGLSSPTLDAMALRELAQNELRPLVAAVPGVAGVTILAGDVREYLVALDPQRLAAHGIALETVTTALAESNRVESLGHSDTDAVRATLLASGEAHDAAGLARVPLGAPHGVPLTVGDVARVIEAPGPALWSGRTDGHAAVIVDVLTQHGSSVVDVTRDVRAAIARFAAVHAELRIDTFWNQALLVSDAVANLRDAILIGLALSTVVLYFFLRNWASTLVAAVVVPLTIVMTFAVMSALHQGLNLMTLGGLAVGVGLIIDDAIVVVENIYRHLARGEAGGATIAQAVSEIAVPMTSSTFTTIVVFVPLALLSGVTGAFFTALAVTVSIALAISLVLALVLTPTIALQALRVRPNDRNAFVAWTQARYEPLLRAVLAHRVVVLATGAALLAATVAIATNLATDFLPALDEGAFELHFALPAGATFAESARIGKQIENVVREDPAVADEATLVGLSLSALDISSGVNTGVVRATLVPRASRASIDDVMDRIERRIRALAPSAHVNASQLLADMLSDLSSTPAPIEIRLFGPEQSVLVPLAREVADRIGDVRGVRGAQSGAVFHDPSYVLRATPEAAAFGFSPAQLTSAERAAIGGTVVTSVLSGPLAIPVRVRYDAPASQSIDGILALPLVAPNGAVEPLGSLATLARGTPQSEIEERDGRQYLPVTAQLGERDLGATIGDIKDRLHGLALPAGYSYEIAGAYALQHTSFDEFAIAIAISVLLVFLIMLVQFRSFAQPLAIVITVPLALFGAVGTLWLTRISLNVFSLMGIILLVGLVVKNGILLLEYAHRRERVGDDVVTALVYAGRVRLRPILMTTLTALLGMLPLAFALGTGSELLQPLAVAVLGGLTFSTAFTLLVIPVVYASLKSRSRARETVARSSGAVSHA